MNIPSSMRRPLPARVVVVAFPEAGGVDGFFLVAADSREVEVPSRPADWLSLAQAVPVAPALSRIEYRAGDNPWPSRQVDVSVRVGAKRYVVTFVQQAGALVQTQLVRTLNCPLNIDCLVAVCFVADLVSKIPVPPLRYLVAGLAVLAILALGLAVVVVRRGFAGVPEPAPLSTDTRGVPIMVIPGLEISHGLPLRHVAAEEQTIALQTVRAVYGLIKQLT